MLSPKQSLFACKTFKAEIIVIKSVLQEFSFETHITDDISLVFSLSMSDNIICSGQPLHVGEEGLQLVHRVQVNALHQLGGEYIRLECDHFIRHGGYI